MNRGVPFGTALRAFSRAVGHGERRPIVDAGEGRPELPDADSSTLSGWLQNFGSRFRNTSDVPHEGPTYNPGMERYATETMFPDSGTAGVRPDPTPEEIAASRAAIGQFGRDVFFGPERESVLPFVDDASDPERLIRDWGLSEQEFRLSGQAFSEGRLGAGAGWGALATMAAIPVVGWAGRGLVKAGRAATRAATSGADAAPVLRAAQSGDNILPAVESEFLSGNVRHTLPESIVPNIPEERRLFAEVLYRQGFSELPEVVSRTDARALAESGDWIPIYRGIRGGEATRGADIGRVVNAEDAAFDLIHGNLYVSSGTAGHGAYFTTNRGWARDYATGTPANPSFEPGMVIDAYIPASARIADGGVDSALRAQYQETYGTNLTGKLDFNTWAAAQGYDAIRLDETFIVLNRSILRMVEEPLPASNVGFGATLENRQRFLTARSTAEAADALPISRMFEGGAAPTPVSQADSDLFRILSDDAIIPLTDRAPFQVAQVSRAQASADVQASAQSLDVALSPMHLIERLKAGSARGSERQFRRDMGVDDSIDIPASVEKALIDKYENSFIRVDPAYDPLTEAGQMLSDAANHMQWETPALLTGRQGTVRREPLYSPTEGILDPNVSLGYGSADPIELWEIAGAISGRARTYQDTHNRIVSDRMLQDLAEEGIGVGTARFGAQEAELLADAMRSFDMRPTVAVPGSALQRVFDDGAILNQYMTLSSSGALAPNARVQTELQVMGIAPMIGPTGRPVYGYVSVAGPQRDAFSGSLNDILRETLEKGHVLSVGRPAGYGEVHFVFGKETANSSLFTLGDSLHSPVIARPLSNPSAADASLASGPFLDSIVRRPSDLRVTGTPPTARFGRQSYVEAHVTQPNFRDVTEIHINEGAYSSTREIENIRGAMKALTGNDVDIYILRERRVGTPDNIVTYDSYLVEPGGRVSTVPVG